MTVGFCLMLEWTLREGRTQPPVPPGRRWVARARYLLSFAAYLTVIGGAFISPLLALGLSGSIAVYYMFERIPAFALGDDTRPGEVDDK